MSRRRLRGGSLPAVFVLLLMTACVGAAESLRPPSITTNSALGEDEACTAETLKADLSPFTVDWSDSQRAALEASMRRGVAVVKMTCDGPEVLKACQAVGDYDYSGVSLKTKLVQMQDLSAASVNLGGALSSPLLKSELSQGRWLNLAYMIAGVQMTSVSQVQASQLQGRCDGATHFVYGAQLGAFTLETSERGESRTASELFVASASAETSSSKSTQTSDGRPDACAGASELDEDRTEGCSALMRVDLMTLSTSAAPGVSAGAVPKTVRIVGCPEGYTWDGDACQPAELVPFELCDELDDPARCLEECRRGSMESCNRFASSFLIDLMFLGFQYEGRFAEFYDARQEWAKKLPEHLDVFTEACAQDMPNACTMLAFHEVENKADHDEGARRFGEGCKLGDNYACLQILNSAVIASGEARLEPLTIACRRGVPMACAAWSELSSSSDELTSDRQITSEVAETAARACYGGVGGYCPIAAGYYEGDEACVGTMRSGGSFVQDIPFDEARARDLCSAYDAVVEEDLQEARALLTAGCRHGNKGSCERFNAIYGVEDGMMLTPPAPAPSATDDEDW